jgi:hypothetical protein
VSAHTPGPWGVIERGNTFHTLGVYAPRLKGEARRPKICTMNARNAEANARLIAAAPLMFAALEAEAAIDDERSGVLAAEHDERVRHARELRKAALAKARGDHA